MRFSKYCEQWGNGLTVEELCDLRSEIVARVENSGCEGTYVEVARWSDKRQRWERFAFNKFFGGELGDESNSVQTARAVCAKINGFNDETATLIHTFPSWLEAS